MKYLKILFLSAVLVLAGYACKKNFLDKAPVGALDPTALANKNGVNGLLIGAYSLLDGVGGLNVDYGPSGPWASAGSNWIYGSVVGTEAHKGSSLGDQPEITPLELFSPTTVNPDLWGKWQIVYDAVSRCNDVIRTAALAGDLSAAELTEILAESRALRAWYHFEAKKMWNKIPFVDETITYADNNYFVKNDVDAWPLIEADLQFAVSNLPATQSDIGRFNKYSAEAVLAKAYMFEHKYAEAKTALEDIINNGNYSLADQYQKNFDIVNKNNSETILAAQSSVNDGANGGNSNLGDILSFPYGGSPGICCGFFQPSQYLVDRFKTDATTGLPDLDNFSATHVNNDEGLLSTDPFTPYAGTLDPRLDWTVGRRGVPYLDWGNFAGNDWIRAQSDGGPYQSKKNLYNNADIGKLTDASYWSPGATANVINLIRYADVLLWAAEVETEIGDPEKARDYVNQVRARAANPAGFLKKYIDDSNPEGGFSNTPAANYKIGLYPGPWAQAAARKAVQFERALELGMEGHRFFDLVRWGTAETELTQYFNVEKNLTNYLNTGHFTSGKNEYFPIPQQEIDKNGGAIVQNPGY